MASFENREADGVKPVEVQGLDDLIANRVNFRNLANRIERFNSISKVTSQKISTSLRSLGDLSFDIASDLDEMVNKGDRFLLHFQRDVRAIKDTLISNSRGIKAAIVIEHLEKILKLVNNLENHVRKVKSNVLLGLNVQDKVDRLLLDGKDESQKFHENRIVSPFFIFFFGGLENQEIHSVDVTLNLMKVLGDQLNILDVNLLRFEKRLSDIVTELKNIDDGLAYTLDDIELLEDAVEKARIGSNAFIKKMKVPSQEKPDDSLVTLV
ncbi:12814_t:CDS:2 [Ambispora leptoticha]|uniref:12814_t:CDS:1 n=1 Tax=Ambispora leptoticha TaxID=144679 RepID=A0A9N9DNK5_9GLOM|nr:12814_t:CDS:2 [Ambispora leptoticha]